MNTSDTNTNDGAAGEDADIILIQGDSVPLPREDVNYTDTWIYKLRTHLSSRHAVSLAQSEKTTRDLHPDNEIHRKRELENYNPAEVILQLGIVDCAPRYFSWPEIQFVRAFPIDFVSQMTRHLAVRLRRRSSHRSYTSESDFESNLTRYLERGKRQGVHRMLFIKIVPPSNKYLDKNPAVGDAIQTYNRLIQNVVNDYELAEAIDPIDSEGSPSTDVVDEYTLSDGYHLNKKAHQSIFETLSEYY